MRFISKTYRQNINISALIDKISKELGVEKSIVLHFVYTDLERIHSNKLNIHEAKLSALENELVALNNRENELKRAIENRTNQIESTQNNIRILSKLLEDKEKTLAEKKNQIENLQMKINELNLNLDNLERVKKQIEYKVMMKSHSIKEKSDISFKRIVWILTTFTFIAIIIAILIILYENK